LQPSDLISACPKISDSRMRIFCWEREYLSFRTSKLRKIKDITLKFLFLDPWEGLGIGWKIAGPSTSRKQYFFWWKVEGFSRSFWSILKYFNKFWGILKYFIVF
jgi:hypothetical protein